MEEIKKIKKLKNKGWNKRLYNRTLYYAPAEDALLIIGFLFLAGFFLAGIILGDENLKVLFGAFCILAWFLPVFNFFFNLEDGYVLEEDCISYRNRFRTYKLLYKDIKCIIIAHMSLGAGRTNKTPCVVMIGGEQEEILKYCTDGNRRGLLTSNIIEHILGAEIGDFSPDNFWETIKKGPSAVCDYGFVWNKREIHKVLKGFQGDYYVAASVVEGYRKKYDEIVENFNIDKERIHIIDDATKKRFKW